MTRKQAILEAIQRLKNQEGTEEIIEKLQDIKDELHIKQWTKKSIIDCIEDFIITNNRLPKASDLDKKGMPPHPSIKLHFKITGGEFLKKYFGDWRKCDSKSYANQTPEYWLKNFVQQYNEMGNTPGCEEYNIRRKDGTPSVYSLKKILGIKTWNELLYLSKISRKPIKPNSHFQKPQKLNITKKHFTYDRSESEYAISYFKNLNNELTTVFNNILYK